MRAKAVGALLALGWLGCSGEPAAIDGGVDGGRDAGSDAGALDAGAAAIDGGDAGPGDGGCAPARPWDAALPEGTGLEDECGVCASRGGPIGGGEGYARAVSRTDATVIVTSAAELLDALASAVCGDVVYVDDAASIDLSAHAAISVPAGVTLASGRGTGGSLGAHLFTRTHAISLFLLGAGVRVTGLRIEGPQQDTPAVAGGATGLDATRVAPVEVDNCELYGWTLAAVLVASSTAHVHHNHIHHNQRDSLGYGVDVTTTGYALIEWNRFELNRHSIASNASPYPRYIARFNLATIGNVSGNHHAFDAHGQAVGPGVPPIAGDELHIHHNTFLLDGDDAVLLAGVPMTGAWIHHNSVAHDFGERAFAAADNAFIYANCWSGTTRCP